jgi:hypothetical protein
VPGARRRGDDGVSVAVVLGAVLVVLGLAVIARTVAAGVGGGLGLLLGAVLMISGGLRLYLHHRLNG